MDAQELLTRPASTLTRKQRRERAALKQRMARQMQIPAGYMLGRMRVAQPPPGTPVGFSDGIRAAAAQGKINPDSGNVFIRMLDDDGSAHCM